MAPGLAGWETAGPTSQARRGAFIDDVQRILKADLRTAADPLGLRLDIGLPDDVPLLTLNDLDNYVYPLIPRLTAATGRQFASVWASKRHARLSSAAVYQAHQIHDPGGARTFQVRTTASAVTSTFKQQVHKQVASARPLPDGGVALQLSFVVGPGRAWPNLWKVTIDLLGPILGHHVAVREPSARDGRITDLGLHCFVHPDMEHDVIIAIRADGRPARAHLTDHGWRRSGLARSQMKIEAMVTVAS